MAVSTLILLFLGGACAGFMNTLAGGGSFLTLPLLIFAGLEAPVANGTNRIAILLQSGLATWRFHRAKRLDWRRVAVWIAPALAGAVAGVALAVEVPAPVLRTTIGIVLVLAIPIVLRPEGTRRERGQAGGAKRGLLVAALVFLCGFYGGFLQAGVGIALLAVFVPLAGLDLVRANAIKNLLVAAYTILALPMFLANEQLVWLPGVALGCGNMLGAYVATRFAIGAGARSLRWVVAAAILLAAVSLLELPEHLGLMPGSQ